MLTPLGHGAHLHVQQPVGDLAHVRRQQPAAHASAQPRGMLCACCCSGAPASRAACGRPTRAHLGSRTTIFTTSASAGLPSRLCICSTQALTSSTCQHAHSVAGPLSSAQPVRAGQWGRKKRAQGSRTRLEALHKHLQLCVELAIQQPGRVGAGQLERCDVPPRPPCRRTLLRRWQTTAVAQVQGLEAPPSSAGWATALMSRRRCSTSCTPRACKARRCCLVSRHELAGAQHCQRLCLHLPEAVEQRRLVPIRNKSSQRCPHKR